MVFHQSYFFFKFQFLILRDKNFQLFIYFFIVVHHNIIIINMNHFNNFLSLNNKNYFLFSNLLLKFQIKARVLINLCTIIIRIIIALLNLFLYFFHQIVIQIIIIGSIIFLIIINFINQIKILRIIINKIIFLNNHYFNLNYFK